MKIADMKIFQRVPEGEQLAVKPYSFHLQTIKPVFHEVGAPFPMFLLLMVSLCSVEYALIWGIMFAILMTLIKQLIHCTIIPRLNCCLENFKITSNCF